MRLHPHPARPLTRWTANRPYSPTHTTRFVSMGCGSNTSEETLTWNPGDGHESDTWKVHSDSASNQSSLHPGNTKLTSSSRKALLAASGNGRKLLDNHVIGLRLSSTGMSLGAYSIAHPDSFVPVHAQSPAASVAPRMTAQKTNPSETALRISDGFKG